MKLRKIWSPLTLAALVLAVFSISCQNMSFADFDADGDNAIEQQEFRSVFMDHYTDDWNLKDNAGLDDEDFYNRTYFILDQDNDNLLVRDEWDVGYDYYYGDWLVDDFIVYDLNRDNYISREEYLEALYDTDYFITWDIDRNTYLSDAELADAVFQTWDTDESGTMNRTEFGRMDLHFEDI